MNIIAPSPHRLNRSAVTLSAAGSAFMFCLLLLFPPSGALASGAGEYREQFVLYLGGGFSLPRGARFVEYRNCAQAGFGFGVVLAERNRFSNELVGSLACYRLEYENPAGRYSPANTITIAGLELKFRYRANPWLRPYTTIGFGFRPRWLWLGAGTMFGLGLDLGAVRDGLRFLYLEWKVINTRDVGTLLSFQAGLRIG